MLLIMVVLISYRYYALVHVSTSYYLHLQYMSPQELWQWVHYSYGDELALTSDDEDYIAPSIDETTTFQSFQF